MLMLSLSLYGKAKALLASRDRGATATEYALLVAIISAALVLTITAFNGVLDGAFDRACDSLNGTGGGAAC